MFDSLLNLFVKDRSFEWRDCFRIPLTFYLPSESLNNIALGDSCDKLSAFGRPDNRRPFKNNQFFYYPLGMTVTCINEKIDSFEFVMHDTEQKFMSAELSLTDKNARQFLINKQTSVTNVERFFGSATEKDSDEDWINLMYHYDKLFLDFEFKEDNLIERFYISWLD